MPRMTGRPTPGPKLELCTPGTLDTVSPRLAARCSSRRSPASTSVGLLRVSAVSPSRLAVTTTPEISLMWLSPLLSAAWRVSLAGEVWASWAAVWPSGARPRVIVIAMVRALRRVTMRETVMG